MENLSSMENDEEVLTEMTFIASRQPLLILKRVQQGNISLNLTMENSKEGSDLSGGEQFTEGSFVVQPQLRKPPGDITLNLTQENSDAHSEESFIIPQIPIRKLPFRKLRQSERSLSLSSMETSVNNHSLGLEESSLVSSTSFFKYKPREQTLNDISMESSHDGANMSEESFEPTKDVVPRKINGKARSLDLSFDSSAASSSAEGDISKISSNVAQERPQLKRRRLDDHTLKLSVFDSKDNSALSAGSKDNSVLGDDSSSAASGEREFVHRSKFFRRKRSADHSLDISLDDSQMTASSGDITSNQSPITHQDKNVLKRLRKGERTLNMSLQGSKEGSPISDKSSPMSNRSSNPRLLSPLTQNIEDRDIPMTRDKNILEELKKGEKLRSVSPDNLSYKSPKSNRSMFPRVLLSPLTLNIEALDVSLTRDKNIEEELKIGKKSGSMSPNSFRHVPVSDNTSPKSSRLSYQRLPLSPLIQNIDIFDVSISKGKNIVEKLKKRKKTLNTSLENGSPKDSDKSSPSSIQSSCERLTLSPLIENIEAPVVSVTTRTRAMSIANKTPNRASPILENAETHNSNRSQDEGISDGKETFMSDISQNLSNEHTTKQRHIFKRKQNTRIFNDLSFAESSVNHDSTSVETPKEKRKTFPKKTQRKKRTLTNISLENSRSHDLSVISQATSGTIDAAGKIGYIDGPIIESEVSEEINYSPGLSDKNQVVRPEIASGCNQSPIACKEKIILKRLKIGEKTLNMSLEDSKEISNVRDMSSGSNQSMYQGLSLSPLAQNAELTGVPTMTQALGTSHDKKTPNSATPNLQNAVNDHSNGSQYEDTSKKNKPQLSDKQQNLSAEHSIINQRHIFNRKQSTRIFSDLSCADSSVNHDGTTVDLPQEKGKIYPKRTRSKDKTFCNMPLEDSICSQDISGISQATSGTAERVCKNRDRNEPLSELKAGKGFNSSFHGSPVENQGEMRKLISRRNQSTRVLSDISYADSSSNNNTSTFLPITNLKKCPKRARGKERTMPTLSMEGSEGGMNFEETPKLCSRRTLPKNKRGVLNVSQGDLNTIGNDNSNTSATNRDTNREKLENLTVNLSKEASDTCSFGETNDSTFKISSRKWAIKRKGKNQTLKLSKEESQGREALSARDVSLEEDILTEDNRRQFFQRRSRKSRIQLAPTVPPEDETEVSNRKESYPQDNSVISSGKNVPDTDFTFQFQALSPCSNLQSTKIVDDSKTSYNDELKGPIRESRRTCRRAYTSAEKMSSCISTNFKSSNAENSERGFVRLQRKAKDLTLHLSMEESNEKSASSIEKTEKSSSSEEELSSESKEDSVEPIQSELESSKELSKNSIKSGLEEKVTHGTPKPIANISSSSTKDQGKTINEQVQPIVSTASAQKTPLTNITTNEQLQCANPIEETVTEKNKSLDVTLDNISVDSSKNKSNSFNITATFNQSLASCDSNSSSPDEISRESLRFVDVQQSPRISSLNVVPSCLEVRHDSIDLTSKSRCRQSIKNRLVLRRKKDYDVILSSFSLVDSERSQTSSVHSENNTSEGEKSEESEPEEEKSESEEESESKAESSENESTLEEEHIEDDIASEKAVKDKEENFEDSRESLKLVNTETSCSHLELSINDETCIEACNSRPTESIDEDMEAFKKELQAIDSIVKARIEAKLNAKNDLLNSLRSKSFREKTSVNPTKPKIKRKPIKLYKPAVWVNKRLYDFLTAKLRPKYGLDSVNKAQNIVKSIFNAYKAVAKSKNYEKQVVDSLKRELAEDNIIVTTNDFYQFVRQFLPFDFEKNVIPCVQPFTNIVWPPKDSNLKAWEPILKGDR